MLRSRISSSFAAVRKYAPFISLNMFICVFSVVYYIHSSDVLIEQLMYSLAAAFNGDYPADKGFYPVDRLYGVKGIYCYLIQTFPRSSYTSAPLFTFKAVNYVLFRLFIDGDSHLKGSYSSSFMAVSE